MWQEYKPITLDKVYLHWIEFIYKMKKHCWEKDYCTFEDYCDNLKIKGWRIE